MALADAVTALRGDSRFAACFTEWRAFPAEPARYADWPVALDPRIVDALARRGIARPYTHQAQAIAHALHGGSGSRGNDQVIVTPTASGKTLCYTAPVLQSILEDSSSRALYLFPTKALAADQLDELHGLVTDAGLPVKTFTYDGDTSPKARRLVRTSGHVVITNPDMLHTGILPNHTKWVRLFENLKYIVIDELHTYRGVFGSNVANLLRRLRRICRFYGSDPVFICCSATIANPGELAEALIGRPVEVVDDNGAPRGERVVALFNPPVVNAELGIRQGVVNATTSLVGRLQEAGVQSIVFAGSRTRVEVLTQYLREMRGGRPMNPGAPPIVRGYRSGYLPKERREIEASLRDGRLRTVVATNALELGIDIGGLDASVLAGYPGTVASLKQQMGRAGRSQQASLSVLVASSTPLDQYVVQHPDFVFGDSVEAARIHPDNPIIAAEHLKCAVFELPLDASEQSADTGVMGTHTPDLLVALEEIGMVHRAETPEGPRTYWSSEAYPAEEVSLRLGAEQNVVIIDQGPPASVIGEVDRPSAMKLLHTEAIYMHDGRQYHVDYLDWEELKAYVRPVDVEYYTDAHLSVDLKVIDEWESTAQPPEVAVPRQRSSDEYDSQPIPDQGDRPPWSVRVSPSSNGASKVVRGHGEVAVTYLATIFKKIRLHTHENIGFGKIGLPQEDLHTGAFWLALPEGVTAGVSKSTVEAALQGVGALLSNVAPLLLMCDPRDLHLSTQAKSPHTELPTIFLWESVPGGVGFGEHLYRETPRLLGMALEMAEGCPCVDGCPGCVGPGSPGAKAAAVRALEVMLAAVRGPSEGVGSEAAG
ncbi:MAG: DEAD/DEAH box helicase [Dehalococcoidia bacterium]|nr:DEAD/DEAH box helicase [Dehalococcoidia bacterium]